MSARRIVRVGVAFASAASLAACAGGEPPARLMPSTQAKVEPVTEAAPIRRTTTLPPVIVLGTGPGFPPGFLPQPQQRLRDPLTEQQRADRRRAIDALAEGQFDEALDELSRLVALHPYNVELNVLRRVALARTSGADEALTPLARATLEKSLDAMDEGRFEYAHYVVATVAHGHASQPIAEALYAPFDLSRPFPSEANHPAVRLWETESRPARVRRRPSLRSVHVSTAYKNTFRLGDAEWLREVRVDWPPEEHPVDPMSAEPTRFRYEDVIISLSPSFPALMVRSRSSDELLHVLLLEPHQQIAWAALSNGLLYVHEAAETPRRAYALDAVPGRMLAVDPSSGRILWQSSEDLCTTLNFVVFKEVVFCGHAELGGGALLAIDARTGAPLHRKRLDGRLRLLGVSPSALFVRTAESSYTFDVDVDSK